MPRWLLSIALLSLLALATACTTAPEAPAPTSSVKPFSASKPGDTLPSGWRLWTLSRFKKATEYQLAEADGRTAVRARANASASGLVHAVDIDPQRYPFLSWRWKVDGLIKSADNTSKRREDSPVRVVLSFAGDLEALPLQDRMFFDNARLLTQQQLPYATLMYIWENRVPRESVLPNLHTSRIKMIVAESGYEKVGTWQTVTRNVAEDYKRAFGEEPTRITAVAVMTDTDNTGEIAQAWYGDIQFRQVAPPDDRSRSN